MLLLLVNEVRVLLVLLLAGTVAKKATTSTRTGNMALVGK